MTTLADRILARAMVTDHCWLWLGGRCTKGYGQISHRDHVVLVHRAIYQELVEPIPDGMVVDHTCHDPKVCSGGTCVHRLCVNPEHLALVTNAENLARQTPAAKTECVHGHPYTPENTGRSKTGHRYCRACNREQQRRWQAARAAGKVHAPEIRAWARENGYNVGRRGALPQDVIEAWEAVAS